MNDDEGEHTALFSNDRYSSTKQRMLDLCDWKTAVQKDFKNCPLIIKDFSSIVESHGNG